MSNGFRLIIAEKPSVARDLARVLKISGKGKGVIGSGAERVTWCVGHLIELVEPAAYDPAWKAWRLESLPMIPSEFRLKPRKSGRDQWEIVKKLLRDPDLTEVINACDAGREGELIFAFVYQLAGCRAPVKRLWISSLTDQAIRDGFKALRPRTAMRALEDAARCRSEADWIVGLNATRAMTVKMRAFGDSTLLSLGRVQTPTLALLDERERAIEEFVPEPFWQVKVLFRRRGSEEKADSWEAIWTGDDREGKRSDRIFEEAKAKAIVERIAEKLGGLLIGRKAKGFEEPWERAPLIAR